MASTSTNNASGKAAAIVSMALLLPTVGARPDDQAAASCVPPADARYGDACVQASNPAAPCTVHKSKSGKTAKSAKSAATSGKTAKSMKSGKSGSATKSAKASGSMTLYYDEGGCVPVEELELEKCEHQECATETDTEGCAHIALCTKRHAMGISCANCVNAKFFAALYD